MKRALAHAGPGIAIHSRAPVQFQIAGYNRHTRRVSGSPTFLRGPCSGDHPGRLHHTFDTRYPKRPYHPRTSGGVWSVLVYRLPGMYATPSVQCPLPVGVARCRSPSLSSDSRITTPVTECVERDGLTSGVAGETRRSFTPIWNECLAGGPSPECRRARGPIGLPRWLLATLSGARRYKMKATTAIMGH